MTKTNLACRVFKEQLNLINQLPEKERPIVLYIAVMNGLNHFENQFDNQIENQNENAYVSVSVSESLSDISKCVLELLVKNITWKEFSNNYGGKRERAGRKPTNNQLENQNDNQVVDIDKDNIKQTSAYKSLNAWGGVGNSDKVKITQQFNIFEVEHPQLKQMLELYGDKIAIDIQNWLRRTKRGRVVEKSFIMSLFYKFYERER